MHQIDDESLNDFVLQFNAAVSTCDFSDIKSDPEGELLKLISGLFLACVRQS